jgi:hypothetical protein
LTSTPRSLCTSSRSDAALAKQSRIQSRSRASNSAAPTSRTVIHSTRLSRGSSACARRSAFARASFCGIEDAGHQPIRLKSSA